MALSVYNTMHIIYEWRFIAVNKTIFFSIIALCIKLSIEIYWAMNWIQIELTTTNDCTKLELHPDSFSLSFILPSALLSHYDTLNSFYFRCAFASSILACYRCYHIELTDDNRFKFVYNTAEFANHVKFDFLFIKHFSVSLYVSFTCGFLATK